MEIDIYFADVIRHPKVISEGEFIAVKSAKKVAPAEPYPWIARVVRRPSGKTLSVRWWIGTYGSVWIENEDFKNCKPDTLNKNLVLAILKWDTNKTMPSEMVTKLKKLYGEGPDEEEDE